ncbi:DUF7128 family protein [Halobellus rubicundus]|uniref:C2H2-type domain-containing protein n=1 Tax=Halobellus rubicundus TaxID=2996466 RepID=A0ABD5MCL7_9EURY
MVSTVERDGQTWYECDECGLLLEDESDAKTHEENCTAEEPSYLQ